MFNRTRSFTSPPAIRRDNIRKKEGRKNKKFVVSEPTRSPIMDVKEKRITSQEVGKQMDNVDMLFRVAKLLEAGRDVNQASYDTVFKPAAQNLAQQAHKVIIECSEPENIKNPAKVVDILRGVENGILRCSEGLKYTTDRLEDSGEVKFYKAREEDAKNVNSQNIPQSVSPFLMVSQPKRKKRGKPIKQQEESNSTGILRQRAQPAPATATLSFLKKSQG